jgi:hypothetical protein
MARNTLYKGVALPSSQSGAARRLQILANAVPFYDTIKGKGLPPRLQR